MDMGMNLDENAKNVKKLLKNHGQEHLLAFWEQLNTTQKQKLLAQIEQLNFPKIDKWVARYIKKGDCGAANKDLASPLEPGSAANYLLGREIFC